MRLGWRLLALTATLLACGHSEPFATTSQVVTVPFEALVPTRLTYNPGNNYEQSWTEDGRGIIYHYSFLPVDRSDDRCVGVLRPEGGSRLWEMCETRREHVDSADSFDGVAINTDGHLLYMELSTRRGSGGLSGTNQPPQTRTLWLADTAFPFQGRKLLDMSPGLNIQGIFFNRLRDVRWIGSDAFVALATAPTDGSPYDSTGTGRAVVRGQISTTGVTLSIIPGTEGTKFYSLAEGGTTLILNRTLVKLEAVPLTGGIPMVRATLPPGAGDITCRGSTCLAGSNGRTWQIDLASGNNQELATGVSKPRLSPISGEVAGVAVTSTVQILVGGPLRSLSSIFLYKELVQ